MQQIPKPDSNPDLKSLSGDYNAVVKDVQGVYRTAESRVARFL